MAAACGGGGVTGTWTGTTEIDASALPTNVPPDRRALIDEMIKIVRESKTTLELKSDQTYTITANGVVKLTPSGSGLPTVSAGTRVTTGTWKQTANTIELQIKTLDGQAVTTAPQSMTVSADGKTLTFIPPNSGRDLGTSKVVFKR